MNVFGIGLPEMAVIAAIGLLVFGPKRLPELGKTLGRTLKGFQSASQEFEKEFRSAVTPPAGEDAAVQALPMQEAASSPAAVQAVRAEVVAPSPASAAADVSTTSAGGAEQPGA